MPGLGHSQKAAHGDYSLERYARDLDPVLNIAGRRKAMLVGHSMGGMVVLTFCRLFHSTFWKGCEAPGAGRYELHQSDAHHDGSGVHAR
jgi:surfactin synthase thioesterase subunit